MGKRQHQSDKLYLTYTEWTTLYGGKKAGPEKSDFKRLPFDHCCVSLQPYEHPYCDKDGNIFELEALMGYLKQYKHNPVTGKPLDVKSLIKLNFHKNAKGEYHCPVLYKVFSKHSHLVAIETTGNVYSFEAVDQLNIKTKSFKDLLTDESFQRKNIITLQDPNELSKFNLTNFHHLKNNLRVLTDEEKEQLKDPESRLKTVTNETRDILDTFKREYKPTEAKVEEKVKADAFNAAHYSQGEVSASFTSTAMVPVTENICAVVEEDLVRYSRVVKKGYVRLVTSLGHINLELYCNVFPKTCENFMKHCENGYYNGTKFHRSIRNFMIQGGDPTGTGTGGESIWGKPFEDEFKPNYTHTGRGVLSMANSGPNTNTSQFFITYRSCNHLDGKHTVFGKMVGGMDTLSAIEKVEVDNKDRPIEDILIETVHIFVNPYTEADEQLAKERAEQATKPSESDKKIPANKKLKLFKSSSSVGKYINPEVLKKDSTPQAPPPPKKSKVTSYEFGKFDSW
ncbi:hypothetical protein M8J75_000982 [Diaphorina citri]|nr:hypothetical protein M8J75_000982 [Diaphorina citri]